MDGTPVVSQRQHDHAEQRVHNRIAITALVESPDLLVINDRFFILQNSSETESMQVG